MRRLRLFRRRKVIQGMNHNDKGDKFKVDIMLDKADPEISTHLCFLVAS